MNLFKGFLGSAVLNHIPNFPTMSKVIGFAISNTGCNDTYPTVFVRISTSLGWIESVVWADEIHGNVDAKLSSSEENLFLRKVIFISVTIAFTITILSLILCIVLVFHQMKWSRNDQEVNLNIQLRL